MTDEPKHISQLNAARAAVAQQSIQDALLAIVVAQGRPVTLPIEHIERLSASHRLIVGVDRASGFVTLTAEKFELETAAPHEVDGITKGTIQ